jgi:hypothetical protein
MAWDEQGSLHCGNESTYGCEVFAERGSQSATDILARRRGWKIWKDQANCPQCSKPARNVRAAGSLEQEILPGFDAVPVIAKKSRRAERPTS